MKTTMDMSSYEIEQDTMEIEYGEEIISSGWNPDVDLICEQLHVPIDEQNMMAADITTLNSTEEISGEVSEMFLRKMYSYQL